MPQAQAAPISCRKDLAMLPQCCRGEVQPRLSWRQSSRAELEQSWRQSRREQLEAEQNWRQSCHELLESELSLATTRYEQLLADGLRHVTKKSWRSAAEAFCEAIALKPDKPVAYYSLGAVLSNAGLNQAAAHLYLEAKERSPVGSEMWACATASAFDKLKLRACAEVIKPAWWNEDDLKELSVQVVEAAPSEVGAHTMRAFVLSHHERNDREGLWAAGPLSVAAIQEAVEHYERAAELSDALTVKCERACQAAVLRSVLEATSLRI
jgi:tetratricopeptide (TPR) repeat protein